MLSVGLSMMLTICDHVHQITSKVIIWINSTLEPKCCSLVNRMSQNISWSTGRKVAFFAENQQYL